MSQYLQLKRIFCAVNGRSHKLSYRISTIIKPRVSDYSLRMKFLALFILITTLPLTPINLSELKLPTDMILAYLAFHKPKLIDMVLGDEIFVDRLLMDKYA